MKRSWRVDFLVSMPGFFPSDEGFWVLSIRIVHPVHVTAQLRLVLKAVPACDLLC